jgi:hypothetical protein
VPPPASCCQSRPPAPSPAAPVALGLFPQALYVSRNALRSLAGAAQFAALRALSAADNLLGDARELRALQAAGLRLELAVLSGNPLAARPNYRAHAIDALGPTLRVLDGRPVGAAERGGAAAAIAAEASALAIMVREMAGKEGNEGNAGWMD